MKNKIVLFLAALSIGAMIAYSGSKVSSNTMLPVTDQQRARTSVTITNFEGTSGGSGVILSSSRAGSYILTNAHVCGLAKNGALVTGETGSAPVASFQVSELHDLCRIKVQRNFGVSTQVADNPPALFDEAIATGHPSLLPTINTHGHFSHHLMVQVLTGFKPCTKEDFEGDNGIVCIFLGGIPIIKTYQSQVISATILPGSSGSPVFNGSGEIAGLVFAGAQGLTYGLIVPHEYVQNFVNNEVKTLATQLPGAASDEPNREHESRKKLRNYCTSVTGTPREDPAITKFCNTISELI